MAKKITIEVVLENAGGILATETVTIADTQDLQSSDEIREAMVDWILSPGDVIRIRQVQS